MRILAALLVLLPAQETALRVRSDFPGGSAKVEGIDEAARTIRVLPGGDRERGWVCWWYFKVEGARPGETLTIDVGGGVWATPDRAAFSADGKEWTQTRPGERSKQRIVYRQEVKGTEAWFAWGPPYVLADARAAVERAARLPFAKPFELTRSRDGRAVPAVRVTESAAPGRFGIWVQARQHAWESGGSWVCQGFLDWLVSDDPRAEALRKRAEIAIVPIMDADNAERGCGGKEGKPQDHNRDWSDDPHWPEVRAAQAEISRMSAEGRFDLFIDLHNPGAGAREPFFYVSPKDMLSERAQANLQAFLASARADVTGALPFKGKTEESGPKYDKNWERISKNWVTRKTMGHVVAVTLETAWNTPASTAAGYREVGKGLGLAVERYFRGAVRP